MFTVKVLRVSGFPKSADNEGVNRIIRSVYPSEAPLFCPSGASGVLDCDCTVVARQSLGVLTDGFLASRALKFDNHCGGVVVHT